MGSGSFIKVVLKNFDVLAAPVITLVYPLYASVKAIETKSPVDDQQWLTYWVLYSLITLFELTFAKVIEWLPFWSYAKLALNCWLVLPYFSGASYVYQHYVRPVFVNHQTVNIWYFPQSKNVYNRPDDVLLAVEKYMKEHGPEAFEKLIKKVNLMTVHELDQDPCGVDLQCTLLCVAGVGAALPVVFVGGKLVGSMDMVMASHINGSLVPLLKDAGALWL